MDTGDGEERARGSKLPRARDPARRSRRDLLQNLAHPPLSDRRFWVAQGAVVAVLLVHFGGELLDDRGVLPVPGFVWVLLVLVPVIYAGAAFGLVGSLGVTLTAVVVLVPEELLTSHDATELWGEMGILAMALVVAVLIGDRFENVRVVANAKAAAEMLGLLRDSEERFRIAFEDNMAGMLLIDPQGRIVTANKSFCELLGYAEEELAGQDAAAFTHPEDNRATEEINRSLLAGEVQRSSYVKRCLRKDGRVIFTEVMISAARDEAGTVPYLVASVRDISERREIERAKDEFLSIASHELRTPLTSIRGSLGLLTGGVVGELPGSARRMLDIALQSTERLIRLINDILDLDRLSTGKLVLSPQACEAASLISRAVEEIRGAADAFEVEVHVGSVEGRVWADPDRVIQTLTNLVGNAIKISPRSGTVWVNAEAEAEQVRFVVEDHGHGIPADQLEAIFGRFHQVDASDSRARGGTGLGLAICRSIVEQHGGRIWAESVLGEGAKFSFTLPTAAASGEQERGGGLREPEALEGALARDGLEVRRAPGGDRRQALVVEDDSKLAEVLEATLARHGLEVRRAGSGREAVRLSRALAPDLLVLDLALPDGDGFGVVEWMRGQGRLGAVPVLVYTAFDLDEADRDRLRLGETRFLTKGRSPPELFDATLEELVERIPREASRR